MVQSGAPAIVPKIADEPAMVHRTGAASNPDLAELSFICVPIKSGNSVIGSLGTDKLFPPEVQFDEDVAPALDHRLHDLAGGQAAAGRAGENGAGLLEENDRLQEELKDRFRPQNLVGNSEGMNSVSAWWRRCRAARPRC